MKSTRGFDQKKKSTRGKRENLQKKYKSSLKRAIKIIKQNLLTWRMVPEKRK